VDSPRRGVEGGQEAVAGRLDFPTFEQLELPAHDRVVFGQEFPPPLVAELFSPVCRVDDVSEEHGSHDALRQAGRLRCPCRPLQQDRALVAEGDLVPVGVQYLRSRNQKVASPVDEVGAHQDLSAVERNRAQKRHALSHDPDLLRASRQRDHRSTEPGVQHRGEDAGG
jgi:hypothetical protein